MKCLTTLLILLILTSCVAKKTDSMLEQVYWTNSTDTHLAIVSPPLYLTGKVELIRVGIENFQFVRVDHGVEQWQGLHPIDFYGRVEIVIVTQDDIYRTWANE